MKIIGVTMNETKSFKDSLFVLNKVFIENFAEIFKKYQISIVFLPHSDHFIENYCKMCDGVILSGNQKHINPKHYKENLHNSISENDVCSSRYSFEAEIAKYFVKNNKPILGICGGMQVMNVAFGGNLFQNISQEIENAIDHRCNTHCQKYRWSHKIDVKEETLLSKITSTNKFKVNSSHTQAVKDLGKGFIISAKSEDGIIEAIEYPGNKFAIGVQWHPEFFVSKIDREIIEYFAKSVAF